MSYDEADVASALERARALAQRKQELNDGIVEVCDLIDRLTWTNTHVDDCPVARYRHVLVRSFALAEDERARAYLAGLLAGWNEGGDEEIAHCTCRRRWMLVVDVPEGTPATVEFGVWVIRSDGAEEAIVREVRYEGIGRDDL